MANPFDDLIPDIQKPQSNPFDDLIPDTPVSVAENPFDDLIENPFEDLIPSGGLIEKIKQSPLAKGLFQAALSGPVSPGFVEAQATPGRAILSPYAKLTEQEKFQKAGVIALPLVAREAFSDFGNDFTDAILGYTSPGNTIVKNVFGSLKDAPAFAALQSGAVGAFPTYLEAVGKLKPEIIAESTGVNLIGTQLELMASPNFLRLVEYPLKVRYKIGKEIFDEIGKTVKTQGAELVVDENKFMRWAEGKSPQELRTILNDLKAGKYKSKVKIDEVPPEVRDITPYEGQPLEPKKPSVEDILSRGKQAKSTTGLEEVVPIIESAGGKNVFWYAAEKTGGSDLVKFDLPSGDTLAMKKSEITPESVKAKIEEKEISEIEASDHEMLEAMQKGDFRFKLGMVYKQKNRPEGTTLPIIVKGTDAEGNVIGAYMHPEGMLSPAKFKKEELIPAFLKKEQIEKGKERFGIKEQPTPTEGKVQPTQKQPWEMTKEEFLKNAPSTQEGYTAEDLTLDKNFRKKVSAIALKVGDKIYSGNPPEIQNHSDLAQPLGFPKNAISGFLDKKGKFLYQYLEDAHKIEIGQALSEGKLVPPEVLKDYPELQKEKAGERIIPISKELKIRNTGSLPRGTGARYLEVTESHIPGEYIAKQWRRKPTGKGILIDYEPSQQVKTVEKKQAKVLKSIVTVLQEEKEAVERLKESVAQGEAGKRVVVRDEEGNVVRTLAQRSTFPSYFQNKGYTKKETLAIIGKVEKGEPLTEKQKAIFEDLKKGALEDFENEKRRYEKEDARILAEAESLGISKQDIEETIRQREESGKSEVANEDFEGDVTFDVEEFEKPLTEKTPAGVQLLVTGTPQQELPKTPLKPKEKQIEEPLGELSAAASDIKQKTFSGFGEYASESEVQLPESRETDYPENINLGGFDKIKPIEMPELVKLAKVLSGLVPKIQALRGRAIGRFYSNFGQIKLTPGIFKNPKLSARVLAHEIGHLIDWLPDKTMRRGNLIGRAISSVIRYMKSTFDPKISDLFGVAQGVNRKAIRNRTFNKFLKEKGLKFGDWITKKEVRERYKGDLASLMKSEIDAEIKRSGAYVNQTLRDELENLSQWWKPFDVEIDPNFTNYRFSPPELYADFLSVLLNAPFEAKARAPMFYQFFFENIGRKPEVAKEFFKLQDLLHGMDEDLLKVRESDIRQMFERAEQVARQKQSQKVEIGKSIFFKLKYEFVDKNIALLEKRDSVLATKKINPEDDPRYLLEENTMISSIIKSYLDEYDLINEEIQNDGLDFETDALLYLERVTGDRSELANPLGHTPETAERQIEFMKEKLQGKQKKADELVLKIREWFKEINRLMEEDIFTPEQIAIVESNDKYAPFRAINHLKEYMSAGIIKQVGTLDGISSPKTAMVLKAISMIRAAHRNRIKKKIGNFIISNPQTFGTPQAAKVISYKNVFEIKPSDDQNLAPIYWRELGKWNAIYVDKYIADSFEYDTTGTLQMASDLADILSAVNSPFRALYITFNVGFQSFNLIRDFSRFWKNTPNLKLSQAFALYKEAIPHAIKRVRGEFDPIIQEMERNSALNITFNQMLSGEDTEAKEINRILDKYIPATKTSKAHPILKPVIDVLNAIKFIGDVIETIPKVAGWKALDAMSTTERAYFVRNLIGTPNFKRRGKLYRVYNNAFMFSNIIKEGIRGDYEVGFTNPKTRSGFWWKTLKANLLPKFLMWAATLGFFGKAIKDGIDSASEYDKTNYIIIPVGEDENGEAIYFRIPQDETGRLVSGLFWKMLNATQGKNRGFSDVVSFTGGQLPSLAPAFSISGAWLDFVRGRNPRDEFRGQEILTDDEMRAGGLMALDPMVLWTLNQTGQLRFDIHDRYRDQSMFKKTLSYIPIANRFLRVSNYGKIENLMVAKKTAESQEARVRLTKEDLANSVLRGDRSLENALDSIPPGDRKSFIEKKLQLEIKGKSEPVAIALTRATSNEQKIAILKSSRSNFETTNEYVEYLIKLRNRKLISQEVLMKAVR